MFHASDMAGEPAYSDARRPTLRFESARDYEALDALFIDAFGSEAEALLVRRLRADDDLLFAIVAVGAGIGPAARTQGPLIGAACFSRVELRGRGEDADQARTLAALAPLAVAGPWRGRGLGAALARAGAVQARKRGVAAIVARGDRRFYEPLGFSRRMVENVACPWRSGDVRALALNGDLERLSGDAYFPRAFFGEGELLTAGSAARRGEMQALDIVDGARRGGGPM